MFQFNSLTDFIEMSGHGPYVWISYAVSIAVMVYLVVRPILRSRQQLQSVKGQSARRKSGIEKSGTSSGEVPEL